MKETRPKTTNQLIKWGLVIIPILLLILVYSGSQHSASVGLFDDGGAFFVGYIIAGIYFFIVLITHRPFLKFGRIDKRLLTIVLIHYSINCFTLNHSFTLFAELALWLKIYLFLFYAAFLAFPFLKKLPSNLRKFAFFFLGGGILGTSYFAIYLAPTYHISVIGLIFFGMSIHLLLPLFVTIFAVVNYIRIEKTTADKALFASGLIIPLAIVAIFLLNWNGVQNQIHESSSSLVTRLDNSLPEWVLLCQDMPSDPFSQKIIKGSMVYDTFENTWGGNWGGDQFDEIRRHDPLINIGLAVFGDLTIDESTRVKILKSQFNARHLTQRKLWTGRDLETIQVLNNVRVFPEFRLAYTEKIITIKNNSQRSTNQQEAAFTFYLPEGSVATSLSLWIDGKEEKSRLTTKEKADIAYATIVGRERRDPALLHWQEGNTLTVTVFPCTPAENRKFKIGITSPLELKDETLIYKQVYFDGPTSEDANETTKLVFESENAIEEIRLPNGFEKDIEEAFLYSGDLRPYWEASFVAPQLSKANFSFNGKTYGMDKLDRKIKPMNTEKVYLDLNKSWSRSEFDEVTTLVQSLSVYVYHDKLIKVTSGNADQVFDLMSKKNFGLFPFDVLDDYERSLVISKSTDLSPNLQDLEDSEFAEDLINEINSKKEKVNLFQLGEVTSPYLKTLKEFQILNFHKGDFDELKALIQKGEFYEYTEDSLTVNLDLAGVRISQKQGDVGSAAPDHLLRMFAYNKVMEDIGRNYFNKDEDYMKKVVDVANEAYVVSPVSSLIVLETIKDYERFDIGENKNSLKNASAKSSGAVPEPHEWVLIVLFAGLIATAYFKYRRVDFRV